MYQATVSFPIPRKKAFLGGSFPGSLATPKNDSLFQFFMFTYSTIILLIIKNNIENIFVFTYKYRHQIPNLCFLEKTLRVPFMRSVLFCVSFVVKYEL